MAMIIEPSRKTEVVAEAEILILGGGPAGIAAATAAASLFAGHGARSSEDHVSART